MKDFAHTRWRHQGLLSSFSEDMTALPDGENILIVALCLQDILPAETVMSILVVQRNFERGFRKSGTWGLSLKLRLRGARLVGVQVLLVVVGCQHRHNIHFE